MSRPPYQNIQNTNNRSNQWDIKELLKQEIQIQGGNNVLSDRPSGFRKYNGGRGNPMSVGNSIDVAATGTIGNSNDNTGNGAQGSSGNPSSVTQTYGFDTFDFYFDSKFRNQASNYANGEIIYEIPDLNNGQDITACVMITVDKFYFPNIPVPANQPLYFFFNRLFIEMSSLSTIQAISGPSGNRFHFECDVSQTTGQCVIATPIRGSFVFRAPIVDLAEFRLKFYIPNTISGGACLTPIPLYAETITVQSVGNPGLNPIQFQITDGNTTALIGLVGALAAPVAAFITKYNSNSAAVNNAVNLATGVFITTVIDSLTFSIAGIDATTVTGLFTATVFIPKNRTAIPIRFVTMVGAPTNNVQLTQF